MIFKGTSKGPDREHYLSDGGKLWIPVGRGLYKPSWGDLLKISWMKVFGIEVVTEQPIISGGSGFSGGGGGGTDRFALCYPASGSVNPINNAVSEWSIAGFSARAAVPRNTVPVPITSTFTAHYMQFYIASAVATTEDGVKILACKSPSTDTAGSATQAINGANPHVNNFAETGLSVAYTAGDAVAPIISCPNWSTPPTAVRCTWSFLFTVA